MINLIVGLLLLPMTILYAVLLGVWMERENRRKVIIFSVGLTILVIVLIPNLFGAGQYLQETMNWNFS